MAIAISEPFRSESSEMCEWFFVETNRSPKVCEYVILDSGEYGCRASPQDCSSSPPPPPRHVRISSFGAIGEAVRPFVHGLHTYDLDGTQSHRRIPSHFTYARPKTAAKSHTAPKPTVARAVT
eukprot:scaffold21588_cov31-Tisochrysis_lutea.AAC.1